MEKEQTAIMLKEENASGTVRIADTVVAHIVSIAATEVEGIVASGNVNKAYKNVKVEIRNGSVRVEIATSIKYGYNIPEVSQKLQSKIKNAIENMTGLKCSTVNVRFVSVIIK